ncbi:MAG TPA: heme-binding protein [Rhodopila sp.]|jgi:uncharacterized protein GlcG (DUF336 family)
MREHIVAATMIITLLLPATVLAQAGGGQDDDDQRSGCQIPSTTVANVQAQLATVVQEPDHNGGLFSPNRMWSAVVDRVGTLCSVIVTGDAWPGSRAIAIAKATTANGFSNDALALSTANLYSPTQPGGSLYGLNDSNPFNPRFLPQGTGIGFVPGGDITFGGGVALYSGGKVIGGLGVSGDTSCADHAISYRMRHLAGLDGTPNSDNIVYLAAGEAPNDFKQPHCGANDITP